MKIESNHKRFCVLRGLIFWCLIATMGRGMANSTGVTLQGFNPTANQIDHLTIHSSAPLGAKKWRFHFFAGTSSNNFSAYNSPVEDQNKADLRDQLTFGDFGFAFGLKKNLELGMSFPLTLNHSIRPAEVSHFVGQRGVTMIRTQLKYNVQSRLDEGGGEWGWGMVGSLDLPNLEEDGYLGMRPPPISTFELFYDQGTEAKSYAFNVGYRIRSAGEAYAGSSVLPLDDQFIFSGGYQSQLKKRKQLSWLAEVYGHYPVGETKYKKPLDYASLEVLLGLRGGQKKSLRWTVGIGRGLISGGLNPDWRIVGGWSWDVQWGRRLTQPKEILITEPRYIPDY